MALLQEFLDAVADTAGELSEDEKLAVTALYKGDAADLGGHELRATVVRQVCVNAEAVQGGQVGRLCLSGGKIAGELNLTGLHLDFGLQFKDVELGHLIIADTRLLALELLGGSVEGIEGDRVEIGHDFLMTGGFKASDCVWLRSASIGGDLNCGGASFVVQQGPSLNLDGARIGGRLYLRDEGGVDFHANHGVFGRNARIAGGVLCTRGQFDRELAFTRAQVQSDFSLQDADIGSVANADGNLDALLKLDAMHVAGELKLLRTDFHGPLITLARTRVDGTLRWRVKRTEPIGKTFEVDLTQAHVGYLDDELDSWHDAALRLQGFGFDGISVRNGEDWLAKRESWLARQADHWSPDPYDQTRAALQSAGHEAAAKAIAIAREEARGSEGGFKAAGRFIHWAYGVLLGYGYRPFRFFLVSAMIVFAFWLGYAGPALPFGLQTCDRAQEAAKAEKAAAAHLPTECGDFSFPTSDAPPYHSLLYSLDAFLPVDLGQTSSWHPRASGYIYAIAVELSLGWLLTGLLVGAVTGVLRRD